MRHSAQVRSEEVQETLALLRLLALGNQDIDNDRLTPVTAVVARLRGAPPRT